MRAGRIAIVGRPNVGKSTLLNALLGERIAITSRHPQTTRDPIQGVVTRGSTQFVFVDTPGLHVPRHRLGERMNQVAVEMSQAADVVLLVVEARESPDLPSVAARAPVILVLNKIDRLRRKAELLPVLEKLGASGAFAAVIPVSARTGDGVERIPVEVGPLLPEGPRLFDDDALTDKPVRFFVAEFVREQILRKTHQEVPHGVAVVVERFDESQPVARIELAVHVAREAHKKILIGARGSMLKAIGTEARARVEALLDRQVHLKLWVRVSRDWYENEASLRELGYLEGSAR
jgi:GTPase